MRVRIILAALLAAACGDPDLVGDPPGNGTGNGAGNGAPGNGEPPETDCFDLAADADRTRFLVLSHPNAADGAPAERYAVYTLDAEGAIDATGHAFEMGRASGGLIHFTPDGSLGLVAQSDGSLGIFRLDADGRPEVIEAGLRDGFYAGSLAIDPAARQVHLLDPNWEENGGALIVFDLDCEGTLTEVSRVPTRLSRAMAHLNARPGLAALAATAFDGPPDLADAHLVDLRADPPETRASALAFEDGDAIVSAIAVTPDDAYVLVGDNSAFSGLPNRIAVLAIDGDGLDLVQTLSPIEDPAAIIPSPFGDALLVTSGFGDAIHVVSHDPDGVDTPFALAGEVEYVGGRPGIPVEALVIGRGALTGHVLMTQYNGIRQLAFRGGGLVEDLGLGWSEAGLENMVGALGVQP